MYSKYILNMNRESRIVFFMAKHASIHNIKKKINDIVIETRKYHPPVNLLD